jgi:hypothetical protein
MYLCHHNMVWPQDADGGESLQIWWLAANTLKKAVTGSRRGVVLLLANWTKGLQLLTTRP